MPDNRYDIEEIMAEIKSEQSYKSSRPAAKKDGGKKADRPVSRVEKSEPDTGTKQKPAKSGKLKLPKSDKPIKLRAEKKHQKSAEKTDKPVKKAAPEKSEKARKATESKASQSPDFGRQDSIFSKDLDGLFADDLPKKKKKKAKKDPELEIKDLKYKPENSADDAEEEPSRKENDADRRISYDFINRTYPDPDEAVDLISQKMTGITLRLLAAFVLLAAALYMTLVFSLKLPLPRGFSYPQTPYLYLLVFFALDLFAVLLCHDVTAAGLYRLLHGKPTLDSLVLFSSLASMAYILTVIIKPQWGGWLPFTAATVAQCFFGLFAKRRRYISLKRTYRIMQTDSSPVAVKAQGPRRNRVANKTYKNVFPEMSDCASADPAERLGLFYAPLVILICLALAAAASFGRQDPKSFAWCLSALSVMSLSPAMLIASALPTSIITKRFYSSGTALINGRAGNILSSCDSAIITDEDVFPNGSVVINSLKIGDGFTLEEAYSVAASALEAIGGGLFNVFDEATKQLYAEKKEVNGVKFFENGGMSAKVGGRYVLLGTASFLRRMGIDVLKGVKLQNCLYLSIDSHFAGVFSLKYAANSSVFSSFRMFRRARCTPILATRDFLTTEAFIEDKFKLRAESCDYPAIEERVNLSADRFPDSEALAVLSRPSMFSFAELLLCCRRLRKSVVFNLFCAMMGAVVGLFIMYFLVSNMEVSSANPVNVLIYLACWTVPVWLSSLIFTRF